MATDHDAIIHRDATGLVIKDSGKRQEFETGARRDIQEGKGRFDLMPPWALEMVSKLYEAGCRKYGDRNWEKGIPIGRYLDSGIRHTLKFMRGDEDEDHLVAACWNLLCCLDTRERIKLGILPPSLDDRPKYEFGKYFPENASAGQPEALHHATCKCDECLAQRIPLHGTDGD
jgi:hypothetical protein